MSGPASTGSKPSASASVATVFLAAASSPQRNMEALCPPKRGLAMCCAPIVLNAFTTLAPAAHRATSSPADVVCPSASPDRSGLSGLVASMTILPPRFPAALMAS